jgi:hypothetical protein
LNDIEKSRFGAPTSPGFAALCAELAGASGSSPSVARNGTILEQAQILTTHNLASLFSALRLSQTVPTAALAQRTFEWICHRQQVKTDDWHAQLLMKNTAYAWRQMLFYLSVSDPNDVNSFIAWSGAHLAKQSPEFQQRFVPVIAGLHAVHAGAGFDAAGLHPGSGGSRFLGWSVGRHWLLNPASPGNADS